MLVTVEPGAVLVLRSSDWRALVEGKDYHQAPGSRVLVLPDDATAADVLSSASVPPGAAPTGAPPA